MPNGSSVNKRQVGFNPSLVEIDELKLTKVNFLHSEVICAVMPPTSNAHVLQNSWIIWELKEKQQNMDVRDVLCTEP